MQLRRGHGLGRHVEEAIQQRRGLARLARPDRVEHRPRRARDRPRRRAPGRRPRVTGVAGPVESQLLELVDGQRALAAAVDVAFADEPADARRELLRRAVGRAAIPRSLARSLDPRRELRLLGRLELARRRRRPARTWASSASSAAARLATAVARLEEHEARCPGRRVADRVARAPRGPALRAEERPGSATTASVPPPNSGAVATRSPICAGRRSRRRWSRQRSGGAPDVGLDALGDRIGGPVHRVAVVAAEVGDRRDVGAHARGLARSRVATQRRRRTSCRADAAARRRSRAPARWRAASSSAQRSRRSRRPRWPERVSAAPRARSAPPSAPAAARRACRRRRRAAPRAARAQASPSQRGVVGQARDGMVTDERGRAPGARSPRARRRSPRRVAASGGDRPGARQLVDVVQQRGGLHAPAVDRDARARSARARASPRPPPPRRRAARTTPGAPASTAGGRPPGGRGPSWGRMVSSRDRGHGSWSRSCRPSDRAGGRRRRVVPSGEPSGRTIPQVNGGGGAARRDRAARDRRAWPRVRHPDPSVGDPDRHAAVLVGPIDARAALPQPCQRRRARDARSGCPAPADATATARPCGVEERVGRRRRAAVVGDLEDVDPWEAALEQDRVDALLDVTGQQEAAVPDLAEQHDRDVVDPGPGVGRLERNGAADRATGRSWPTSSSRRRPPVAQAPAGNGIRREFRVPGLPSPARARASRARTPGRRRSARAKRRAPRRDPRADASGRRRRGGGPTAGCARRGRGAAGPGSGPPSTSIRRPRADSSRIASPCPTSSTVSCVARSARSATASPASPNEPAVAMISATSTADRFANEGLDGSTGLDAG